MARVKELRSTLVAYDTPEAGHVPAMRAAAWLEELGETLGSADVPEAKSDLIHAIYERIVVAGPEFIEAHLTPAAYAHGLAGLLPEVVMAPPAGFEPATGRLEGGCSSPLSYGGATSHSLRRNRHVRPWVGRRHQRSAPDRHQATAKGVRLDVYSQSEYYSRCE